MQVSQRIKLGSGAVVRSTPRRDGPSLVQGRSPISARIRIIERNQRVKFSWLRRPGGSAPWTPDGVPPLSLALRGGSPLYQTRRTVDRVDLISADASLGTDKTGSGAYGPSGSRAEPWPLLFESNLQFPVARTSIFLMPALMGLCPWTPLGP